ncbi:hypothetical protein C3K47_15550 [Solitalea longa]|uniref:Uncharacterized protein n=1 Tax=Solitalea longa TaxID=2079460 RepID=A0A2S5A023_9SPHI|nr:hypothetical protein C3K47_15550 [Solitalea longa]
MRAACEWRERWEQTAARGTRAVCDLCRKDAAFGSRGNVWAKAWRPELHKGWRTFCPSTALRVTLGKKYDNPQPDRPAGEPKHEQRPGW